MEPPGMVKLADLPDYERDHLLSKNMPPLGPPVWTSPTKPLSQMRFAIVTTAGLHYRDDPAFDLADATFRPIDGQEDPDNLVMSHSSVNFDRTGFAEDVNIVFPLGRFRELAEQGVIGSLADVHYSFMGAGLPPDAYERSAAQVAGLLKQDRVDAVFLTPV
jgi:D-proline reductase (dithiol) PrdB